MGNYFMRSVPVHFVNTSYLGICHKIEFEYKFIGYALVLIQY